MRTWAPLVGALLSPGAAVAQEGPPSPVGASPAVEAPGAPAQRAQVSGQVRQRGTRRSLPCHITGPGVDAHFAAGARFAVEAPVGARLVVTSPGFVPASVEVGPEGASGLLILLDQAAAEVIVVTEDGAEREHVLATSLPRQMVDQTPGTYGDSVRLVQSLPGVVVTPEYSPRAGDIAVRGTGPGDSRFFLDGVDLPYLYHFQQYSSVIPTDLLEEITLYPSTFRPTFGNAVGAVVDARTRDYRPDTVHARLNVNLVMAGGAVQTPVGESGVIAVGGRRSYLDRASGGSSEYTVWPIFWDYHARYDYHMVGGRQIGVFAYGAGDRYERYLLGRTEPDPIAAPDRTRVRFDQHFHAFGSRCEFAEGPYRSRSVVAMVLGTEQVVADTGAREAVDDTYLYVRHDGQARLGPRWELSVGGELRAGRLAWEGDPRGGAWAWPEPILPAPDAGETPSSLATASPGLYVEASYEAPGGIEIKPGVRADAHAAPRVAWVDPRLTVLVPIGQSSQVRAGAGLYHQAVDPILLEALGDSAAQAPHASRSAEAALGLEQTFAQRLRAHVQAYYKDMSGLMDPAPPGGDLPRPGLEGQAFGVEAILRYHLKDVFFMTASYAWSQSWRADPTTGETWRYDYDQPHALSVVTAWQPSWEWNVGLRYRLASGMLYTPVAGSVYDGGAGEWVALPGERNSERFPLYHKIDGHIEKVYTFDRWTLAAYAELWFVVPSGNVLYPVYSYDYAEMALVSGPVFIPLVGVRGSL